MTQETAQRVSECVRKWWRDNPEVGAEKNRQRAFVRYHKSIHVERSRPHRMCKLCFPPEQATAKAA
jgi:hypothetical protein